MIRTTRRKLYSSGLVLALLAGAPLVVQAGTATSTRGRGEANSFNAVYVEQRRTRIDRHAWDADRGSFDVAGSELFERPDDFLVGPHQSSRARLDGRAANCSGPPCGMAKPTVTASKGASCGRTT